MSYKRVNADHSLQAIAARLRAAIVPMIKARGLNDTGGVSHPHDASFFGGGQHLDATPNPVSPVQRAPSPRPVKVPAVGYAGRSRKIPARSDPTQSRPTPPAKQRRVVDPKPSSVTGAGGRSSVTHPTRGGSYIPRSSGKR